MSAKLIANGSSNALKFLFYGVNYIENALFIVDIHLWVMKNHLKIFFNKLK